MTGGCASRTARATVFTAAAVLLAAFGHHMMSAAAVPWWALAVAVLVIGTAAWLLTARERGTLVVIPATLAAQSVLHFGFTYAQRVEAVATLPAPSGAGGHGTGTYVTHSAHFAHTATAHAGHLAEAPAGPAGSTGPADPTGMLAAHVLTALLCALWLARGERAAFRMQRLLCTVRAFAHGLVPAARCRTLPVPPHRPRVRPPRRAYALPAPRRLLLVLTLAFRGPPVA